MFKNFHNQLKLYKDGLDFAPWERWSVCIEDDRDHFVSGNFYFSLTKFTAWLWAVSRIGNKRRWKLIQQKHMYF